MAFETEDPAMQGWMILTVSLSGRDGGTWLDAVHDNVPPGVSPQDNETGWRMALDKLAAIVERDR